MALFNLGFEYSEIFQILLLFGSLELCPYSWYEYNKTIVIVLASYKYSMLLLTNKRAEVGSDVIHSDSSK